ncbi:hypothetical protein D3C81_2168050 [compost metagenome]
MLQRNMPVAQPFGIQRFARWCLQQPDAGGRCIARQFGDQRQAATVRRTTWVASDGQARGWKAAQLFEETVA